MCISVLTSSSVLLLQSVRLSDDDLRNLLLDCEEDMIRSPAGSSSESSLRTSSAPEASPRLSGSDLGTVRSNIKANVLLFSI